MDKFDLVNQPTSMPRIKAKPISINTLLKTYQGLRGGELATLQLLGYHLRQGNIRSRAKQMWKSEETKLSAAWRAIPDPEALKKRGVRPKHDVKRSVWNKSVDWQNDLASWNVRTGKIFVTVQLNPVKRIMIRGFRLHSADVRKAMDVPKLRKARDNPHDGWRAFWHEIIKLVRNGRNDLGALEDPHYASNDKLADHMTDALGELVNDLNSRLPFQLSPNEIYEEVAALRQAFLPSKRTKPA